MATGFVSQPNPTSGSNGSFVGSVKVLSVTGGSSSLALGAVGSYNFLGRLEIVNVGEDRDRSWKGTHPQDNFLRIFFPMSTGTPGLSNPTFHPWSLQGGSFTITSGTGMVSTSSGNSVALIPTKDNGVSRLIQATFTIGTSPNFALIANWCRNGTNNQNWIGAHVHAGGSVDIATGAGTTVTALVSGATTISLNATSTLGIEVLCDAIGVPVWIALLVNGVQKATYGLTAAQQAALNFQTGATTSPPYTPGSSNTALDGVAFLADEVTAVTYFGVQDAVPPLPSAASGTVTLSAGTVTVANAEITSSSVIRLNRQAAGGTLGELSASLSAGTSFTINSSSGSETSTVCYEIVSYWPDYHCCRP